MKKIFFPICFVFCIINFSFGQGGTWTWVSGDSTGNADGVFGTQGVPSVNNRPPGLSQPAQWTDLQGNFWLFGGNNTNGYWGALWKYNPTSSEWTWVQGPSTPNSFGNYGTRGVASPANEPPCRGVGLLNWTDTNGDLWMFGGDHTGSFNDLWRYNIASNEWTWMKGANGVCDPGSYGTKGVEDSTNNPPPRYQVMTCWTDNNGNFWLFGGFDNCFSKCLNDLWRYNPATNNWTWMSGSNTPEQQGVYGTLGVADANNVPGARSSFSKWKDSDGNLWMFGGEDINYPGVIFNYFNDLWKYDITSGYWTWESGSNLPNEVGSYSSYCTHTTSNFPHSRWEDGGAVTNSCGSFLTFGGATDNYIDSSFNDLWMYNPATNKWTWLSGDSVYNGYSSYGTLNVASSSNMPPARGGSLAWMANDGNLYIFGGYSASSGDLNDMWKYAGDSTCSGCNNIAAPPIANLQSGNAAICANSCINFTDFSRNAPTSWLWTFDGATPPSSSAENPQQICYANSGNFSVKLVVSNGVGSDSIAVSNAVTVYAVPPTPTITHSNDTLYCSFDPSYTSYQWYADSSLIPNATNAIYVITINGNYNVKVSNENGCSTAVGINIILGLDNYSSGNSIALFPNPVEKEFTVCGFPH